MTQKWLTSLSCLPVVLMGAAAALQAAPCPTATLDVYLAPGFSCTINGVTVSQFSYSGVFSGPIVALGTQAILVTPITNPGNEGLRFSGSLIAGNEPAATSSQATVTYLVAGPNLGTLEMSFNGATQGPSVTAVATESYCLGGTIAGCGSLQTLSATFPIFTDRIGFGSVSQIGIQQQIQVTSAGVGTAEITEVADVFASAALIGGGIGFTTTAPLNGTGSFFLSVESGPNAPLTGLSFDEFLGPGMAIAAVTSNTCGGTLTAPVNGTSIMLTGGSVPAAGGCTVNINYTALAAGILTANFPDFTTDQLGLTHFGGGVGVQINQSTNGADLTPVETHQGNWYTGQQGAVYHIKIVNSGNAATSGTVTVTAAPASGLTATAISGGPGSLWSCTLATLTCTRSDVLAAGASYDDILLTVNVSAIAGSTLTSSVTVSGGGEVAAAQGNDTLQDVQVIQAALPACTPGPLTGYLAAGFVCRINNMMFSAFSYDGTGTASAIPASGVTVEPVTTPGTEGFQFSAAWSAAAGQSQDSLIHFTAGTVDSSASIRGMNLSDVGFLTGDAINAATTTFCPFGVSLTACFSTGTLSLAPSNGILPAIQPGVLAPMPAVTISDDITVGAPSNSSKMSQVTTTIVNGATANGPDVNVIKTHSGPFAQGDTAAALDLFSITVSNVGSAATSGTVTLSDTLPAGLTAVALAGAPGWTCDPAALAQNRISCTTTNALPAPSVYTFGVSVAVAPNAALSMTNTATVAGGGDVNPANNTATDPITITAKSVLNISKSHSGTFQQNNPNAAYTITVTNNGGAPTSATWTVTDTLPAGLGTISSVQATGVLASTCALSNGNQTVTCTENTALTSGSSVTFTLNVSVAANAPASVTNTATVAGGGGNVGPAATDMTTQTAAPDLTITKYHTGTFRPGDVGDVFAITVTNAGGPTFQPVTVTDVLPLATYTATAISGTGWTCTLATLVCTRSDVLAAGASYPAILLTVNVGQRISTMINTATVAGGGEVNTSNDTATDNGGAGSTGPDLTITKIHNGSFKPGDIGDTYSITVSNVGAAATAGTVTVTDTLPAGLTATAISGTGWTCTLGTLTCTRTDALAAGASYPVITLTVNISQSVAASVTNVARVAGGSEANPANDTASDTAPTVVTVTVGTNLTGLSFTVDNVTYTSTQTFTWQLGTVHNIGTTSPQHPSQTLPTETFQSWSDAGAINHAVTANLGTTSYLATFVALGR